MGLLDDVLKALDRFPVWKRLQELPAEVDDLKTRISALEAKLGDKWPPDVCRHCGERALRLVHANPNPDSKGYMREDWKCEKCEQYDIKAYKPGPR